ncbi:FAD/NAD(P)-binding domain-containing protein [Lophiostoma macrostomum CBS 122681]|uniref:FAD/NAD(P)-binding domain-containing protein n=1 Tax=Lophiostoma macrostomum CBS 122681 TaxID=1314788 RepID=A0A6A6TLD7_9PLEO|nr:FAD/NAD(P)-binding domain-containing protein [Lophiostoma macrostomum CBS 122681]
MTYYSKISTDSPILIVGAGVAGLALAQGLRLRSIPFRVFERSSQGHPSQGHRFRISKDGQIALSSVLSPNSLALLRATASDGHRFEPRYVDARSLEFPKPTAANTETMPSMPADRTWIRMLLMLGIEDAIEYEKEFSQYKIENGQVHAHFADGSTAKGTLLIGADGIRSRVRRQLQPDRHLLDLERWVMWGRTPLTESLYKELPEDLLTWCMYLDSEANSQAVVEPMVWSKSTREQSEGKLPDFGDYIYWVICTASQDSTLLPRTIEEKRSFLERVTQSWHPGLKHLLHSSTYNRTACIPVISSKPDIEIIGTNETGQVTLVGDAAHVMSPMGGSGGDTAIRVAADLARTIAEEGISEESIADFEARMTAMAEEKIHHSFNGGKKFWKGKDWTEYKECDI